MRYFTKTTGNYYVSYNATITGDVTIGELSSLWFGAVVRGDVAPVTIGKRVNVQDQVVIHCDTDVPNVIEDDVSIGHGRSCMGCSWGAGR
jgi:carbonic anhydrase/acetyltransferase-like protein (isoleucine patch superfamily)